MAPIIKEKWMTATWISSNLLPYLNRSKSLSSNAYIDVRHVKVLIKCKNNMYFSIILYLLIKRKKLHTRLQGAKCWIVNTVFHIIIKISWWNGVYFQSYLHKYQEISYKRCNNNQRLWAFYYFCTSLSLWKIKYCVLIN